LRQAELNGESALVELRTRFANSGYVTIRKTLGLGKVCDSTSDVILKAIQNLAQLQLNHCADILQGQFVVNNLAVAA